MSGPFHTVGARVQRTKALGALRIRCVLDMAEKAEAYARAAKERANTLGFDGCGIAPAGPIDSEDHLGEWLRRGYHADMDWMARTKAIRQDVSLKVPGAKSVVVVAKNYYAPRPRRLRGAGQVARYAWGRDYHRVLRKPLRDLAAFLDAFEADTQSYASVDSGPVLERAWALRAGLGWAGKNALLLNRAWGSWFFLATIVTTVELAPDAPVPGYCGSCTACLDACPAGAIVAPGVVDARRCISYHTIENRGDIPDALHRPMGDWVFGCDICQEVCPWNRTARLTDEEDFWPRDDVANPDLGALLAMDEEAFNARFQGTPLRRAKYAGIRRNAAIALENSRETGPGTP